MKFQHGTKYMICCFIKPKKSKADNYKPDIIIGVARGGLVPARILSDLLETTEFATIQIEYY